MLRYLTRVCLLFLLATPVAAEIQPSEIAILSNKTSRESRAVATYYAKSRKIPMQNICQIEFPGVPGDETLDRAAWEGRIRPEIRSWIKQRQLEEKIRLFVTVWDVPLKIGKQALPGDTERLHLVYLERERAKHRKALEELVGQLTQVALPVEGAAAAGNGAPSAPPKTDSLAVQFGQAFEDARNRVNEIADSTEKQQATTQLQELFIKGAGLNGMVQNLSRNPQLKTTDKIRTEFDVSRGRMQGLQAGRIAVAGTSTGAPREAQALSLVLQLGGEAAAVEWLDQELDAIRKEETQASFDSELSLLLWPDYNLLIWQPNYLHYSFDQSLLPDVYRTLMVGRLEAPTLALTKLLVDRAIAIEQKGLTGTIYLDARGIAKLDNAPVEADGYADYDRSILIANQILKDKCQLPVVLNTKPELFQAGECPDAAVYCGWYSLAKYVDAFEWAPGAVAYHIASAEATTIRKPGSQVWCKRMLEDGVSATFGPVYEPYLTPFPKPHEFLPLLLSGKHTVAECYYRTTRCRSWMMTLIGDPLYNPFKNKPAINADDLPEGFQKLINGFGG